MYEIIAALITGVAAVIAARLTKTDISNKVAGAAPEPSKTSKMSLEKYIAIFVVGAIAGALLIHTVAKAAEKGITTGGYKVPVGTIVAFMGKEKPDGWLVCDGKPIEKGDEYKELRSMVGDNTPNLQGRFLRGLDQTGTIDPDGKVRSLGSTQEDAFKEHSHAVSGILIPGIGDQHYDAGGIRATPGTASAGESNPKGGTETRPKNVAVNFIIKY